MKHKPINVDTIQGLVVQSIISLTKLLVNAPKIKCANIFAEKMRGAFFLIFSAKNVSVFMYNMFEILTSR